MNAPDVVQTAHDLIPLAAASAPASERESSLAAEVVAGIAEADLFRLCVPRSVGGHEAGAGEIVGAIEALSQGDGAAGWCLMIAATAGLVSGWLERASAAEVFGRPDAPCGGVFAPRGRAEPDSSGYRVTGRWPFSSGVRHSAWMLGGCVVHERSGPRLLPSGAPDVHLLVWPRAELEIVETWSVTGLRGTGSHDMQLDGMLVPSALAVSLFTGAPVEDGPLYAFPIFGLLAVGVAAVGLGIARAALDDLTALAGAKTPSMSTRPLADHPSAQATAAGACAQVSAARAFLYEAVEEAWAEAVQARAVTLERRARLRLAATHAAAASAAAVAAVYHAAGGSSIYTTSPLERRFRDVHTLRQHMIVGPATWELAGRVLLGARIDATML